MKLGFIILKLNWIIQIIIRCSPCRIHQHLFVHILGRFWDWMKELVSERVRRFVSRCFVNCKRWMCNCIFGRWLSREKLLALLNGKYPNGWLKLDYLPIRIVRLSQWWCLCPLYTFSFIVLVLILIYHTGPISYRSPGPVNAIDDNRLWDSSYDGSTESAIHFDGLGKLIDGVKPSQGETISDPTNDWRWVGWPPHNHSESSIVKLEFEFDQIVNFTTVSLNCQNSYSRNVRVFSTALVWFSLDRQSWSQSPIRFVYEADNVIQLPRGKLYQQHTHTHTQSTNGPMIGFESLHSSVLKSFFLKAIFLLYSIVFIETIYLFQSFWINVNATRNALCIVVQLTHY